MATTPTTRSAHIDISALEHLLRDAQVAERAIPAVITAVEEVVAQGIAGEAADSARSLGSVAGKAADELRYSGGGTVEFGGEPWDLGAEFGALRWPQFDQWLGNSDDAGYFLFPTVREWEDSRIGPEVIKAIDTVLRTLAR